MSGEGLGRALEQERGQEIEQPPRAVWVLAGVFCIFIAATGRLGLAGVGAVSLAYLWWRLRK